MSGILTAQIRISGTITNKKGETLPGVNIYFENSYDGTTSDNEGYFEFYSQLTGKQMLITSFIGYEAQKKEVTLSSVPITINVVLKESTQNIEAVVITAGQFEAGDEKKAVVLKPLDIATTAGSAADIYGSLATLPGTQKVGEEGKLFVRGGEAYETKTYMDGMLIQNPYSTTMPDVPSRGRFSPFLFKGTVFSTGGYSAEYGQALSSAVILETYDLPEKDVTGISLLTVGVNASHTKRWKSTSLSLSADYQNLAPYFSVWEQTFDWQKKPETLQGQLLFRQKTGINGMIKSFGTYSKSNSKLAYFDIETMLNDTITLTNDNSYFNTVYTDILNEKWIIKAGVGYNFDHEVFKMRDEYIETQEKRIESKLSFKYFGNDVISVKFGGEYSHDDFNQEYRTDTADIDYELGYTDDYFALFGESEIKIGKRFATRAGTRLEYSSVIDNFTVSPRLSFACKTGRNSQLSFAYGTYYQLPENDYLKFNHSLKSEQANHYIFNFQRIKDKRISRIEVYHKEYNNLVKYTKLNLPYPETYNNLGTGYARGVDFFWRDERTFENTDYWISYSYTDTKRNYKDYPVPAVPIFISDHNLSLVYKRWIDMLDSEIGFSYSFASGRPYYNPNNHIFHGDRTKQYHDLSLNISYLTSIFKQFTIIYFSFSNLLGYDTVYGYDYASIPDESGSYQSFTIKPGAKRFAILMLMISIE